jgi:predicted phosphodiesterase
MITLIGDVHGNTERYNRLVSKLNYSVQLGDMGFDYSLIKADPERHKFLGGNHDNYDMYRVSPHSLGDYGEVIINYVRFFFIRGGFSIDKHYRVAHEVRTGYKSFWREEQLDEHERENAYSSYCKVKPNVMLTHTCPSSVAFKIGNPNILKWYGHNPCTFNTDTQKLLQRCLEVHQPKVWCFGHFHKDIRNFKLKNCDTNFNCVGSLNTMEIL